MEKPEMARNDSVAFPTQANWISDASLKWPKKESPVPFVFQRTITLNDKIKCAKIFSTAMGIYELELDGIKVGQDYFAPGFTSYRHQLQYQTYDVTEMLRNGSVLTVTVAGGWAVGAFTGNRKSRIAADLPSLLLEVHIEYEDGKTDCIGTDRNWKVTTDGPVRAASWYDGEIYDANTDLSQAKWKTADIVQQRLQPDILPQYGPPVRVWNTLKPIEISKSPSGEWIYDFSQNFAGVIDMKLSASKGQEIVFRHAEVLHNGELYVKPLRTAKQTVRYICRDGEQHYSPRFTYMGFRYVGVTGIDPEKLVLQALALSSDLEEVGSFACSNMLLNRLNENIRWSARSNFVDIPTDCPQRDERMGWTGDIALFARTACWNYDMSRFFGKWLKDVASEQDPVKGIPMVVPRNGHEWPPFPTAVWGDCCVVVPWAEYLARGDLKILEESYPVMKRFLKQVQFWAGLFSSGKDRYIWKLPFQFGDWCAPEGEAWQWKKKGPWIATAYFANSCGIAAETAKLLGYQEDAQRYLQLREKIVDAYRTVFTDGKGKLTQEFQTGYTLPLYFGMVQGEEAKAMAAHLARLVTEAGNKLTTGFPGTPYILFALADNGYAHKAYEVLLQEACPSWLYEVKSGATTIWERWDSLDSDGNPKQDAMLSFNHYAYGAVGDFLYRRVLGIEAIEGGYRSFRIAPVPGGDLTWAEGGVKTPCGKAACRWEIQDGIFRISVEVPPNTHGVLILPSGATHTLENGIHQYSEPFSYTKNDRK